MNNLLLKLRTTLEMIKFEHTLFALPFAFLGAVLAAEGLPGWRQILWITVAMVGARSAAMTFNRIVDRDIDAANPRTANRELPSGKLSVGFSR
jgi:4-hydroxybenzoate polyprenyltransferase